MADERVVLSDALCFLKSKFGKTATKSLRLALSDFYSGEELSVAKQQLLEDVSDMKSSVKFPHVPRRRDGDDKATRVTDDIILLFTCIDENKLIDQLPRYVSDNPDALPSIRLYEGDLYGIIKMLDKLNDRISECGSAIAILSRDLQAVQAVQGRTLPSTSTDQSRQQPSQSVMSMCQQRNEADRRGPPPLSEFPAIQPTHATVQSADQPTTQCNLDWGTLASTPYAHHNRFGPLASTTEDDEQDEQDDRAVNQTPYTLVRSKRNKRPRNRSNQQPASNTQSEARQTSSILGKSRFPGNKMAAARVIRKKSVFCIDNLNTSCTVGDITEFVTNELSVEVLNCFEAKPRRRRGDDDESIKNMKAFRLCICEDGRRPNSIIISDWYFKNPSEEDKRP